MLSNLPSYLMHYILWHFYKIYILHIQIEAVWIERNNLIATNTQNF